MRDRFGTNIAQTRRTLTPQGEGTAMVRQVAEAVPVFSPVFILLISFLFIILFSSIGWSITPAGAIISNNAKATYTSSLTGNLTTSSSNTVSVTTAVQRTTAVIEFLQFAPTAPNAQLVPVSLTSFSPSGNLAGPFVPLGAPVPAGSTAPIDLTQPLPLVVPTQYHTGEPVFIRLSDRDQNNDPAVAETVVVTIRDDKTGDREVLRLTETGLNTGVFLGYVQSSIQPATSYNGLLSMVNDSNVIVSYTDSSDPADKTSVSALVDPYGIVFNSVTGQPVDGAIVTLVNAATGNPATVYGDDGIATFPSNLTTGGTAVDSSGRSYTMTPGGYRFPFISPGRYRLNILPPSGYRAPSNIATAVLQSLPGAPFAIAEPGSRNEEFLVNAGPAIRIDIPVDPLSTLLYLIKSAGKDSAAIGDFVPYQLTVENLDKSSPAPGVTITDRLPVGFRYRKGSARLNISPAPDPAISEDGRSITFAVGALGAAANAEITYVAEVGAGASLGKAVNTAVAHGSSGAVSNNASATVVVSEDLFGSKTTIVGRVLEGCGDNGRGIAGIRIFLEDGSYVVTDKNGMYHFAALNAGTHVVQLDTVTVPEQYEPAQCQDNTRYAGRSFSQFVDLQGGSLWRADFHLVLLPPKAKQTGEVGLELRTSLVATQTGPINHADAASGVSLTTAQTCTFGEHCFGELKKNSLTTDQTGTARPDTNDHNDYAAMVPFVNENCSLPDESCRYTVAYSAKLKVGAVSVRNLRLIVMIPDGVTYIAGSSCLTENRFPDPDLSDGILTYHLGERPAGWEGSVVFLAAVPAQGGEGSLSTKAFLVFDTPAAKGAKTPVADTNIVRYKLKHQISEPDAVFHPKFDSLKADLSFQDRKEISKIIEQMKSRNVEHITVIGHTDTNRIRPGASKEFPDNYVLSQGRAKAVASVIAEALRLTPDQITIVGKGPDEPLATNKTAEGRALNRRVEFRVDTRRDSGWTYVRNDKETSGMKSVSITGLSEGEAWARNPQSVNQTSIGDVKTMPDYDAAWVEKAGPELEWLWPVDGYHPAIASLRIVIKHDPSQKPKLFLNDEAVDILHYEGMVKKSDGTVAVSFWRGIHLQEGDNKFELVLSDGAGSEVKRLQRTIHYSGPPSKAVLLPERSKLIADGKNPIILAIQLLDKDGHPAREGVRADFFLDPPYIPKQSTDELQQSPLIAPNADRYRYLIGEDGVAMIELVPTTQTGEAVVRVQLDAGRFEEIRTWLKPGDRDWVLVGLAEGTVGYDTVKGNMETFTSGGGDDKFYKEDRLAFYAKGRIKGEWLLTLAYDSKKATTSDQPGLYQTIDPNKYYTLYGDGTLQGNDAASAKRIYVKLERDQFYALFGDFNAGLTVTELSRYNRNFTGFKSEMKTKDYEYSVFVADTSQAHVRDELQGDGTSGLYHLSRKNIVLNSERITIETRDRFKSEVILSSQQLTNLLDYTIDYDAGTIFFKTPVFSRDGNFNPNFIVADYESFDDSDAKYNYGGRAAARFIDGRVEVGASHIHEGQVGGSGNLEGVDAKVKLGLYDMIRAEAATTKTDQAAVTSKGDAYLVELQHRSETVEGKAYVREQQGGFGLGQQNGSETGTRKVGADFNYRINKPWTVGGEAFEQNDLSTGAVRNMAEVRSNYTSGRYTVTAGLRRAEDTLSTAGTQSFGETQRSDQLFSGVRAQLTDKTAVRISRDQSIGANNNVDFPTRTTVGADYKLNEKSTFFADQEWTNGSTIDTQTTRIGIRTSPWTGGQIGSSVEQQSTENGVRLFATTGLKQSWQITKQWSVDGGLDRSQTLHNTGTYSVNTNVPPASGSSEDFTATSLGVGYRQEKWSWTARAENRDSDSEHKFGLFMGANGEVREGLALALGLQTFRSKITAGEEKASSDLRLSLVHRPFDTRVIILDRLDLIQSEQHGGTTIYDNNKRFVNNLVANIKTDSRTQVSLQYASKYVQERIDENDYRGYTDLIGIEGRFDVTKTWDIGLGGMRLHSWSINQEKYGTGASVGFNAGRNIWVSVGYNFTGFKDRDFSKADFTSEGPFIKMRMKFDQVSVRDAVKWFSGQ
ncbi:MAG: OmpA family protein [Nitrospirota bacterium]